MTIVELWNQMLNADLIPILEAFAVHFFAAFISIFVTLGCICWWITKRKK